MTQTDRKIKQEEIIISESKTNHILHLILSIITGGLWLIVWIIIGLMNEQKRVNAQRRISAMLTDDVIYKSEPMSRYDELKAKHA